MDNKTKKINREVIINKSGIYVDGNVISQSCKVVNKKDGSGQLALARYELATRPGLVVLEEFYDPVRNPGIKIQGDSVIEWPQYEEFEPISLRAGKCRIVNDTLHVSNITIVG